jgi:hypothetical protein
MTGKILKRYPCKVCDKEGEIIEKVTAEGDVYQVVGYACSLGIEKEECKILREFPFKKEA